MARVLTYLPQLLMAAVLLLVGWCLSTEFRPELARENFELALPFIGRSVAFAIATAAGQTLLGLLAALSVLWLARRRLTQMIMLTIFLVPYAIPASLIGLVFRFALGGQSAWAQMSSSTFGIPSDYWLYAHPLRAASLASIWQFFPFAFLLIFLALRSIPQEVIRSAQIDGAPFSALLRDVVLARIWPVLASVFALRIVFMLVKFDTPFVFTETIASPEDVATVELWRAFSGSSSPELAVIAWCLQLLVLFVSLTYIAAQRRRLL